MTPILNVAGIGPGLSKLLAEKGIATVEQFEAAPPEVIMEIPGIGERRAAALLAAAGQLVRNVPTEDSNQSTLSNIEVPANLKVGDAKATKSTAAVDVAKKTAKSKKKTKKSRKEKIAKKGSDKKDSGKKSKKKTAEKKSKVSKSNKAKKKKKK